MTITLVSLSIVKEARPAYIYAGLATLTRTFFKIGPNRSSFIYYDPYTEHINTQINFHPPPGFEPGPLAP